MLDTIIAVLQPLILIKIVAIIFVVMVLIFILVVAKQVFDMNETIHQGDASKIVEIVAVANIILVFVLLLTAIVIL